MTTSTDTTARPVPGLLTRWAPRGAIALCLTALLGACSHGGNSSPPSPAPTTSSATTTTSTSSTQVLALVSAQPPQPAPTKIFSRGNTTVGLTDFTVPRQGYQRMNNAELGTVLSSPLQSLTIPQGTVSFLLILRGKAVTHFGNGLFIADLTAPDGTSPSPLFDVAITCDTELCTADLPKRPDIAVPAGTWHFRLGTQAFTTMNIDFSSAQLQLVTRVGPMPNLGTTPPVTIRVHPFLTASSVTTTDVHAILDTLAGLGTGSDVGLDIAPLTVLNDPQYSEVSDDFNDANTASLVSMGDNDAVNLFFVDGFTGPSGAGEIGISAGIPATLGIKDKFNGALINATATYNLPPDDYARTTAEFAFHEMGHLLGLYHTTEQDRRQYDILDDTPECLPKYDTNNNHQADVDECPDGLNLLFWTSDFSTPKEPLTTDQRQVFYDAVIATP